MKIARLALLFLTVLVASGQDPFADGKSGIPQAEAELREDDTFKVFPDPEGRGYFPKGKEGYYTKYLSVMKEPSVMAALSQGVTRVFRFTYLRSFHDPLVFRIVDKEGELMATSVRLRRDREMMTVKIDFQKTWSLQADVSRRISSLIVQKDFWKPLNKDEDKLASSGLDGSRWIFEIHDKDGYRLINVWSPDAMVGTENEMRNAGVDPSKIRNFRIYRETGCSLLEIGGILPVPMEIY